MELGSSQTADSARTEVRGEGEGEEEEAVVERAAVPVEEEAVVEKATVPVERVGQEEKEEEEEGEGACSDEELDELLNCQ